MDERPEARAELQRVGVPLVPAVVVGDRAVHGWNPAGYAGLLGVDWQPGPALAPAELAARLDVILDAAEALVASMPAAHIGFRPPERDRSLGQLAFHVFRLALAFADGVDRGRFPEDWLQEQAPAALAEGPALARYGALVRARLQGWFAGAGGDEFARVVQVYYGPQTGHELLERTTWHAAQHLRQLYDLAGRLGIVPPRPLPVAAFAGLPLPAALW